MYCLALLAYLFPATTKCGNNRISRKDMKEDFFVYAPNPSDKNAELEKRNKKLAELGSSIHPVPIFVGQDFNNLSCFVEIDNTSYRVQSPIEAIDSCFKIYKALGTRYPVPSERAWLFLQRHVFGIKTTADNVVPDLLTVATALGL